MSRVKLPDAVEFVDATIQAHMSPKATVKTVGRSGGKVGINVLMHKVGIDTDDATLTDQVLTDEASKVIANGVHAGMSLSVIYMSLVYRGIMIGAAAAHLATQQKAEASDAA